MSVQSRIEETISYLSEVLILASVRDVVSAYRAPWPVCLLHEIGEWKMNCFVVFLKPFDPFLSRYDREIFVWLRAGIVALMLSRRLTTFQPAAKTHVRRSMRCAMLSSGEHHSRKVVGSTSW
ncbi:hypothetical protein KC341_g13 [Hortaea werneckii]|nr:hypothetical protein KC341_g13 [Hortaea werneckii]